jgi:superfamily I DNA and RNA helicase
MKKTILIAVCAFLFGVALTSGLYVVTQYEGSWTEDGYSIESKDFWNGYTIGVGRSADAHRQSFEEDMLSYLEEQSAAWNGSWNQASREDVFQQLLHGVAEGDYLPYSE